MEAIVRTARAQDIPQILELQHACYPVLAKVLQWRADHLRSHLRLFPEGQFVAESGGRLVGTSSSFRIASRVAMRPHTFSQITGQGYFALHDPEGDALYGAEIMVLPARRKEGIARRFYEARYTLIRRLGIHRFIAGGRIPGFAAHAQEMSAEQYVERVKNGELADRVLTPQLRSGLKVAGVMREYIRDPNSCDTATLLVWEDTQASIPLGEPRPRLAANTVSA